jgi:hypothetical protein
MMLANDWESVILVCKQVLETNPDDWYAHESLISAFISSKESHSTKQFIDFNKSLQESVLLEKNIKRGPFLAEIYYLAANQIVNTFSDILFTYVERFGTTLSCFDDLYPKLQYLPSEQVPLLLPKLMELLKIDLDCCENKIDQTRLNITVLKLQRYLSSIISKMPVPSAQIALLLKYYNSSSQLSNLNINSRSKR